jgi:hypothetical protein
LHIADHLHPDGATPTEIAAAEALDDQATFRFLRACASSGLASSEDGAEATPGAPFFDWLTVKPGEARVFTDAMTA